MAVEAVRGGRRAIDRGGATVPQNQCETDIIKVLQGGRGLSVRGGNVEHAGEQVSARIRVARVWPRLYIWQYRQLSFLLSLPHPPSPSPLRMLCALYTYCLHAAALAPSSGVALPQDRLCEEEFTTVIWNSRPGFMC